MTVLFSHASTLCDSGVLHLEVESEGCPEKNTAMADIMTQHSGAKECRASTAEMRNRRCRSGVSYMGRDLGSACMSATCLVDQIWLCQNTVQ